MRTISNARGGAAPLASLDFSTPTAMEGERSTAHIVVRHTISRFVRRMLMQRCMMPWIDYRKESSCPASAGLFRGTHCPLYSYGSEGERNRRTRQFIRKAIRHNSRVAFSIRPLMSMMKLKNLLTADGIEIVWFTILVVILLRSLRCFPW
jgi:hypothetical protein